VVTIQQIKLPCRKHLLTVRNEGLRNTEVGASAKKFMMTGMTVTNGETGCPSPDLSAAGPGRKG
jgi:hypothetical protein